MGNMWLGYVTEQHMSESRLEAELVGDYGFSYGTTISIGMHKSCGWEQVW